MSAPAFVLAIAAVKTAYDTYLTFNATIGVAKAAIVAAGASPTPPTIATIDADWNNYVTANEAWIAANIILQANLQTAITSTRNAELGVIIALGYNSGDIPDSLCLDQWVKVVGAGGGILTYTDYIGASKLSIYLTIVHTPGPAHPYPNTSLT